MSSRRKAVAKKEVKPIECVRNYASESGKPIPVGACPRIGLSRPMKPNETNTESPSSTYAKKAYISPEFVRCGLLRVKKSPACVDSLFTSPLLTPGSAGKTDNVIPKAGTPSKTSSKCPPRNLQKAFINKEPNKDALVDVSSLSNKLIKTTKESEDHGKCPNNSMKLKQRGMKIEQIPESPKNPANGNGARPAEKMESDKAFKCAPGASSATKENVPRKEKGKVAKGKPIPMKSFSTSSSDDIPLSKFVSKCPQLIKGIASPPRLTKRVGMSEKCPILQPELPIPSAKKVQRQPSNKRKLSLKKSTSSVSSFIEDLSDGDLECSLTPKKKSCNSALLPQNSCDQIIPEKKLRRSGLSEIGQLSMTQPQSAPIEGLLGLEAPLLKEMILSLREQIAMKESLLRGSSGEGEKVDSDTTVSLKQLTKQWEDGCKQALIELHQKLTEQEHNISMESLLDKLGIPQHQFLFDSFNYCFL